MSGTVVNLLDRKRFEYSFLSGSAAQSMIVVPRIDACGYGYLGIYARVHERSMTVGQSLTFSLYNIVPSDEDAREFVETDVAGGPIPFLTVIVNSAQPALVPGFYSATSRSFGPYLKLGLSATQASSPAIFYAEVSLLLHMRETA